MDRLATLAGAGYPVLSWADFWEAFADPRTGWQQGEHVTIIGANGSGKTVLAKRVLTIREWVAALISKNRDRELESMARSGFFKKTRTWPPPAMRKRLLVWPSAATPDALRYEQWSVFDRCLADVSKRGGWCVYADELRWLCQRLGLSPRLEDIWFQGRSEGISLVASVQRPSWVPLSAYTEATHVFLFRASDARDLKTIGGIGNVNADRIRACVSHLPATRAAGYPHDEAYSFAWVNTRAGTVSVSRVES